MLRKPSSYKLRYGYSCCSHCFFCVSLSLSLSLFLSLSLCFYWPLSLFFSSPLSVFFSLSFYNVSVCLPVCLSVCLPLCPSICLSLCLPRFSDFISLLGKVETYQVSFKKEKNSNKAFTKLWRIGQCRLGSHVEWFIIIIFL